jgi:hypothetical protein
MRKELRSHADGREKLLENKKIESSWKKLGLAGHALQRHCLIMQMEEWYI